MIITIKRITAIAPYAMPCLLRVMPPGLLAG
jgi:hypothetical protein